MIPALARSYRFCDALAQRNAGNFYPAFRILPHHQRLATCALYAYFRIADDISDDPGPVADKRLRLHRWRASLKEVLAERFSHSLHPALCDTLHRYRIPVAYLEAVLDGVAMDLEPIEYTTFAELQTYCYRVASAVGLACIHVWGFTSDAAKRHAEQAGLAFQLTNILRDLGEDAQRGRVYLPSEDLQRFQYPRGKLLAGQINDAFCDLMRFQVARARDYYDAAWPIVSMLSPPGRAVFLVLARTYRRLLEEIEARGFDVFTNRVRVGAWRKLLFALEALPVRWGWF